jgi:carboxylesterase type B
MHFVRSNADALGIDLSMLAIFGESAGAANTGAHLLAHRSRGLFARAAMESGPPAAVWTSQSLSRANARLANLAKNAGCPSGDALAACLRTKNTTEIMAADKNLGTGSFPGLIDWSVVVDGVEFTEQLHSLAAAPSGANLAPVPVLLGSNRDEGSTFTHLPLTGNETDYVGWLTHTLGANSQQLAEILRLYVRLTPLPPSTVGAARERQLCARRMTCR